MSDAKKNQFKIAKARSAYKQHLEELQTAGLVLSVSDPNGLTSFDLTGSAVFVGAIWNGDRVSRMLVTNDSGSETGLEAARSRSAPVPPAVHPQLGVAVPIY